LIVPSFATLLSVTPELSRIFQETHRELRPRTRIPNFKIEFYAFANINNTIRMRQDRLLVRISDLLEGAPEPVLHAILHILLAKIYRKDIDSVHAMRYRRYISSHELSAKAHVVRQMRGRKHLNGSQGEVYDLHEIFDELNRRFFHGLLGRPQMSWSREHARNNLGHYDPAHNTIVVSRAFDGKHVPRYAVEYLVYHEMLHLKHPVRLRGSRRCFHSREFQAEEKLFPHLEEAKKFLKCL
jgi:hypothetical protein